MTTTNKKMSKDTKDAWDGYAYVLNIIAAGLKQGIDEAIADHMDPNGIWRTSTDARDYADKLLAAKKKNRKN